MQTSDSESYPVIKEGVACKSYVVAAGDTWLTIAEKNDVDLVELLRVNPSSSSADPSADTRIFLPPCNDGGAIREAPHVRAMPLTLAACGPSTAHVPPDAALTCRWNVQRIRLKSKLPHLQQLWAPAPEQGLRSSGASSQFPTASQATGVIASCCQLQCHAPYEASCFLPTSGFLITWGVVKVSRGGTTSSSLRCLPNYIPRLLFASLRLPPPNHRHVYRAGREGAQMDDAG